MLSLQSSRLAPDSHLGLKISAFLVPMRFFALFAVSCLKKYIMSVVEAVNGHTKKPGASERISVWASGSLKFKN